MFNCFFFSVTVEKRGGLLLETAGRWEKDLMLHTSSRCGSHSPFSLREGRNFPLFDESSYCGICVTKFVVAGNIGYLLLSFM
jgi:hypothetical protein